MKEDTIIETLQEDIVIPDIVWQKANLAFEQIKKENEGNNVLYKRNTRRSMWTVAAAALALSTVTACAAVYMHWSSGMEAQFNATQEQKQFLEDNNATAAINKSVTKEGITVTAQQSIADERFAHLSFRVDGYEVREGSILLPDFEEAIVTIDGKECDTIWRSFYTNMHITDTERVYTDGTPIAERNDGSLIERYMNADGSMEYIISLMTDNKDNSLVGKSVHVELRNLGTYIRHLTSAYKQDVDAAWTFDFTLKGSDKVRSLELSEALGDSGATVTKAELSPISFYVEYNFPRQTVESMEIDENGKLVPTTIFADAPRIIGARLKDGTMLIEIVNGGSDGYEDDSDTYTAYFAANHIIDPEEVDALLFLKSIPEQGEGLTEENLYIVPF